MAKGSCPAFNASFPGEVTDPRCQICFCTRGISWTCTETKWKSIRALDALANTKFNWFQDVACKYIPSSLSRNVDHSKLLHVFGSDLQIKTMQNFPLNQLLEHGKLPELGSSKKSTLLRSEPYWPSFWNSIRQSFWHSIWHLFWHSFCHSGPSVPHGIRRWRYGVRRPLHSRERRREGWQRVKDGGRKERRQEGRVAPLLKSRGPHLAGEEKHAFGSFQSSPARISFGLLELCF